MGMFRLFTRGKDAKTSQKPLAETEKRSVMEETDGENPLEGNERYERVADINRGTFGFVTKAKDIVSGKLVAIKFLPRGPKIQDNVAREILNHQALRHPHVVQFRDVFLTDQYLAIAMEYADQGDLFKYVRQNGRLREDVARWIFQQLIFGLDYCHRKGVASRDIKLENVLLQSGARRPLVKLCDFGYSKHEDWDSAPTSRVGTPDYMSPEILKAHGGSYDAKKADLWSCGVVLFALVVGQYPFSLREDNDLLIEDQHRLVLDRIIKLKYDIPPFVSAPCADLVRRLLDPNPETRITIPEIIQHPWHKIGLPPTAANLNDVYMQVVPESSVSEADIKNIVNSAMNLPGKEIDSVCYIDQVMEEEDLSLSDPMQQSL